ncbi:Ribose-5-phosphate isomerase B [Bacteroidales bacterium Barb7]|nr:Ribose-5-phosphate isomerase B [Bacteroidales bacterium Barb7]
MSTIGLCSDHAGFEMKEFVKQWLDQQGIRYKDFGTYTPETCDYPDYGHRLALAVESGEVCPGIAVCGTGCGISITLNKHQGIRAAQCWQERIAELSRSHNDANVLVLPGRFISHEEAARIVEMFLVTPFAEGRHRKRIDKIPVKDMPPCT